MYYSQLRAFHAVASEGAFTKAAARLNVTQPTVSTQVRELEEEFGVRLFVRQGRDVVITDFGKNLLTLTRKLFDAEAEAEQMLSGARSIDYGHIHLGSDSPHLGLFLLKHFREAYPVTNSTLHLGTVRSVIDDLLEYRIDVAVVSEPPSGEKFHVFPVLRSRLCVQVPKEHEWAKEMARVSLEMLAEEPLVLQSNGSITRKIFETAMEHVELEPRIALEINSREGAKEATALGLGAGIVSAHEAGEDQRLVTIPLDHRAGVTEQWVVALRDRARLRVIKAFVEIAEDIAEANLDG